MYAFVVEAIKKKYTELFSGTILIKMAVDTLLRNGLHLFNRRIVLRRYDEILLDEYIEYQTFVSHQNKLYAANSAKTKETAATDLEDKMSESASVSSMNTAGVGARVSLADIMEDQ